MSALSKPLKTLSNLLQSQEEEATSRQLSSVSWYKDVFRISGSAIHRVWKAVIIFTVWSCVISVAQDVYGRDLTTSSSVIPIISVVVGLLLVFRNSSAFARWEDGRRTFGAMSAAIRNIARYTWVNVGASTYDSSRDSPYKHANWTEADQQAKVQAMRLAVGIIIACKHHVRGEFGSNYDDLDDVLPQHISIKVNGHPTSYGSFPQCSTPPDQPYEANSPDSVTEEDHVLIHNQFRRPAIPLPLTIVHYLQSYFARQKARGFLDMCGPAGYNNLTGLLNALTLEINALERLSTLPIPLIYGIHLKQTVTLYLFLVPLTLVDAMGYAMIPFVTAMAFILLGVEGIASEIEQPFGRDLSDLPLDYFCTEIRNEVEHLIAHFPDHLDSGL